MNHFSNFVPIPSCIRFTKAQEYCAVSHWCLSTPCTTCKEMLPMPVTFTVAHLEASHVNIHDTWPWHCNQWRIHGGGQQHSCVSQSVSHMPASSLLSCSFLDLLSVSLFIHLTSEVRARPTWQAATDDKQKQHAPWNHEEWMRHQNTIITDMHLQMSNVLNFLNLHCATTSNSYNVLVSTAKVTFHHIWRRVRIPWAQRSHRQISTGERPALVYVIVKKLVPGTNM